MYLLKTYLILLHLVPRHALFVISRETYAIIFRLSDIRDTKLKVAANKQKEKATSRFNIDKDLSRLLGIVERTSIYFGDEARLSKLEGRKRYEAVYCIIHRSIC